MKRSIFFALFCAMSAPVLASPARSFSIGGVTFEESDIIDARAQPDLGGTASILITFETVAAKRIAQVSRERLGQPLPIILDGKTLAAPRVVEPIEGGTAQISGSFPLAEADRIARLISGKDPLPDSLEGDEP